jgi:pyruvate kinase
MPDEGSLGLVASGGVAGVLQSLRELREQVAAEGAALHRSWRPRLHRPQAAASMLNLAHYLALRHRDLRPLQAELALLGLSSLGRAEGHVVASLDAVLGAAYRLCGAPPPHPGRWPVAPHRFARGDLRLQANTQALFGPAHGPRETRIMVTLPSEAATDGSLVADMVRRGAEIVRINCA